MDNMRRPLGPMRTGAYIQSTSMNGTGDLHPHPGQDASLSLVSSTNSSRFTLGCSGGMYRGFKLVIPWLRVRRLNLPRYDAHAFVQNTYSLSKGEPWLSVYEILNLGGNGLIFPRFTLTESKHYPGVIS